MPALKLWQMKIYKSFYIQSKQEFKGMMDKASTHRVDGIALSNEIEALLHSYGSKGYELHSFQPIHGGRNSLDHTQGVIVILQKDK